MKNEIELTGLDGANPLGYLAALGTLRTISLAWPNQDVKLAWHMRDRWIPVLSVENQELTESLIIRALYNVLHDQQDEASFTLAVPGEENVDTLKRLPSKRYRQYAEQATTHKKLASFAATWGSEISSRKGKTTEDEITATQFDFTAGNQKLLQMTRDIAETTTEQHLESSLFKDWNYPDKGVSLRWDLLDETRRYALQAIDPTDTAHNPILSMLGANRLAVEALPLFPVIPAAGKPQTTGFTKTDDGLMWTWSIWSANINIDVVRSILASPQLQTREIDSSKLKALGIEVVYRSLVIAPAGYYRCFAPPQSI